MKNYSVTVVLLSSTLLIALASGQNSDGFCNTTKALAQELYDTDGNVLRMTKAFFPPLKAGPKYLLVKYTFLKDDYNDDCSVTYIWTEGGFLLIQPPWIFQFTSLFFNHVANSKDEYHPHLEIKLPPQCQHLVQDHDGCSCNNGRTNGTTDLLDMLTHEVRTMWYLMLYPTPPPPRNVKHLQAVLLVIYLIIIISLQCSK